LLEVARHWKPNYCSRFFTDGWSREIALLLREKLRSIANTQTISAPATLMDCRRDMDIKPSPKRYDPDCSLFLIGRFIERKH
jgi:hypothetical protein